MSLCYTPSSIVGGPLSPDLLKLLKKRQEVLSKKLFNQSDLSFLNGTTGWVKLTSSIDTKTDDGFTSDLARKYVLLGGTLYQNSLRQGFIDGTGKALSSYELSPKFGYVPMPGIFNFTVASKNNFGTLRVSTIEFKANSIEQLTDLEQLYLRPGFSVLIEWGNSTYINSKGKVTNNVYTVGDKYFDYSSKSEVIQEIDRLKKLGNYNYDAMYGFVKNFTWAYSNNGEYDCKLDVVSTGELVESLQTIIFSGNDRSSSVNKSSLIENCTPLHEYLYTIKNLGDTEDTNLLPSFFDTVKEKLTQAGRELKFYNIKVEKTEEENAVDGYFKYIPLSNLLAYINESFTLKTEDGAITSFYIDKEDVLRTPFTTFLQHYILDPAIGFLPKENLNTNFGYEFSTKGGELGLEQDILNICVNIDYVINILNDQLQSTDVTQKNLFDLIQSIINGIAFSAGNINEFDIHYEEDEFRHYIIDRRVVPSRKDLDDSQIDVIGLGTTVMDLSLSSKLTSKVSATVAIAAQAANTDAADDMLNLQRWNYGLKDRTLPEKFYTFNREQNPLQVLILTELRAKIYKDGKLFYDAKDLLGAVPYHAKVMSRALQSYTVQNKTNAPGIIPLELSLTLKGIAGFRIGQAFTIPHEILPARYSETVGDTNKSKMAFIITGVDHRIEDNRWNTYIRTQSMITSTKQETDVSPIEVELELLKSSDAAYDAVEIPEPKLSILKPVPGGIRNDSQGGGTYMSARDGGTRRHRGIDLVASPGTVVIAPFDGNLATARTTTNLPKVILNGINDYRKYSTTMAYVEIFPNLLGQDVSIGTPIGRVVDLSKGYPDAVKNGMINHIDIKLDYNNQRVDPQVEFGLS